MDQHDVEAGAGGSSPHHLHRDKNPVDLVVRSCSITLLQEGALGLTASKQLRTLVKDVSFSVKSGELFAIMGGR
jgi:ABC-type glutathione transport system ATPase component